MLIAYLTTDEVNQDLATQMADDCGVALAVLSPRDPLPNGQFDAAIHDLDYVPPNRRDTILAKLSDGPNAHPVAVHSYHLTDEQIEALHQQGAFVYRRLDRAVFLNLVPPWRLNRLRAGREKELRMVDGGWWMVGGTKQSFGEGRCQTEFGNEKNEKNEERRTENGE